MSTDTILVLGSTGQVGRYVLDYLARTPSIGRIVATSIEEEQHRAQRIISNSIVSANIGNIYPKIVFTKLNLEDEDETINVLQNVQPKVIIHSATLMSSYYYIAKIKKIASNMGFKSYLAGHTLAKDLHLIYKLMRAVAKSGIKTFVVNLSFPDITNYILAKVGLSPTVGAGTIDLTVNGIKRIVANNLGVPANNLFINMVAHHSLRINPPEIVPFYLKIKLGDKDVTDRFDLHKLVGEATRTTTSTPEVSNAPLAASSAYANARNILFDTGNLKHAPGANGMIGGTPVRLDASGVEIILPEGLSMKDAEDINMKGLKFDGIERIADDGTVVFTEQTVRLLHDVLNLSWDKMKIKEAKEMSDALVRAYQRLS